MALTKSRYSSDRALAEMLKRSGKDGWIVSVYQKLEPADRMNEKYRIKLKNRLRRAAERLDVIPHAHGEREAILDALRRIEDFFAHPSNLDGGRGMAVFAGPGFFRAVALPRVLKSRVLVDKTPIVGELVSLAESRSRTLVVAVDRRSARFFDVEGETVTELPGMPAAASRTTKFHADSGAPGVGEYKFHTRIREEKHRHLARVAEAVIQRFRNQAYDGLLIGGIGVEGDALERHLHHSIKDRVPVGKVQLTPKQVTLADVTRKAAEFMDEAAGHHEAADLERLREALGTGWAVEGVEATLKALNQGQVAALLVDHDAEVPGFRFEKSGRLTADASSGREEGEAAPVADVIDDAIEDALRQRSRVAVLRGTPARRFKRLAGILRFQAK